MVVAHFIFGPIQLLLGPGELSHSPFGAFLGVDELKNLFDGDAVLDVIVVGVFLHDVFGYDSIFKSLHQGVHDHIICVGGLAHL